MVLQNYQKFIEMNSIIFHIVVFGVGFKCPRKIYLNIQCPVFLKIPTALQAHDALALKSIVAKRIVEIERHIVEGKAQKSTTFGKLGRTRKTPARDPSFERYDLFVDKCILCRPIERKEMSTPPATFFGM